VKKSDDRFRRLLRARDERPRGPGAEQGDERASPQLCALLLCITGRLRDDVADGS
jgi:hypothetical protein